ncbi:MAG: electron transfer flavoprotein subunit beta/FixA family protein [Opitutae bacterium]
MKILVPLKRVPDPDTKIRVKPDGSGIETDGVKFAVNPFDSIALEEALRLRERVGAGEITVVTIGGDECAEQLRTGLAMGADRAILVKTDGYFTDSVETGRLLHCAIFRDGSPDLILTGRQSVDTEAMQIPYRLGVHFDMPVTVNVVTFSMLEGRVTVEREIEGDVREVIEMTPPCVVGAARGLNRPRCPTLPEMMKAKKKSQIY